MSNNTNPRPPRTGVIIIASVLFLSIFVIAFFNAYEQKAQALGHSVHIAPASANYGTVSSVPASALVSVPMRHSAPLLSGHAIRTYAYSGHATMPKTSSASGTGFKIHTTSSASMHSYGSGGGGGAMGAGASTSSCSSSRGIRSSGSNVAIPMIAMAATAPSAATSLSNGGVMRKEKPSEPGTFEDDGKWSDGGAGDGYWYRWDDWEGEWVAPEEGDTRLASDGVTYVYHSGSGWVAVGNQSDPTNPTPLGDTPWLWILLLIGIYLLVRHSFFMRVCQN